jgi:succinate dehydrogenase/fumarate reductase flavoprotein subunit
MERPYPIEWDQTEEIDTDVLVIGGGASGCFAAMGAASRGARGDVGKSRDAHQRRDGLGL